MQLVTGGAGFIGSRIVVRLVRSGESVRVFDNFSSGKLENLRDVRERIDVQQGDLRDLEAVRLAARGAETIYHHGAIASVDRSFADPGTTLDVNVGGTLNVLLAARDMGCRRVIFASSSAVYGDVPKSPKVESMSPRPQSPYAISKMAGEQLCRMFTDVYRLETIALRYFNVFGPGQDLNSPYAAVIPRFLHALRRLQTPVIYGDGKQSRDFVYIDDVVEANLQAARATEVAGCAVNIATGRSRSINDILREIEKRLGIEVCPDHAPGRPGDIRDSVADISAARRLLGFTPRVDFGEGIQRTIEEAVLYADMAP